MLVVRSRGVMEKCSMCIQMYTENYFGCQSWKDVTIKDGEFQTACSAMLVIAGAMVFGDINDKESQVAKVKRRFERMYHLLEHVGTTTQRDVSSQSAQHGSKA